MNLNINFPNEKHRHFVNEDEAEEMMVDFRDLSEKLESELADSHARNLNLISERDRVKRENAALRDAGWRIARALECARGHGYQGGGPALAEWSALANAKAMPDGSKSSRKHSDL